MALNDLHQEKGNDLKHLFILTFCKEDNTFTLKVLKTSSLSNETSFYSLSPEGGVVWNVSVNQRLTSTSST